MAYWATTKDYARYLWTFFRELGMKTHTLLKEFILFWLGIWYMSDLPKLCREPTRIGHIFRWEAEDKMKPDLLNAQGVHRTNVFFLSGSFSGLLIGSRQRNVTLIHGKNYKSYKKGGWIWIPKGGHSFMPNSHKKSWTVSIIRSRPCFDWRGRKESIKWRQRPHPQALL